MSVKQHSFCGRIKVPQEGASQMNYSAEYKEAILRRMLPPNNESITKIAKEEGLSEQTLRNWRDKARKEGYAA
ncbi:MAG: helix-turn-helix domain containing protein, partial [Lachnospiraceae bacterium]|nr:helix-turn-helix domain containing protein [Lachnospiraceae bacterium]